MEFLQKYHSEIVHFIKRYVSTNNKISDDMKGLSEQFSGIEKIYKKTAQ